MGYSVTKNAAFMTAASILQKVISFVYFTLIANTVGVEGTGKYFVALSFTTIFVIFIDLGLTNVFVREAAKAKEKVQSYLSTILFVKLCLGALTYAALLITVQILGYDGELRTMVYLSGITMLFDALHLSIYGAFRALQELRYEAMSIPACQAISLTLGSIFLYFHLPLYFLILAFTIPSVLNVIFAGAMLYKRHRIVLKPVFDPVIARTFFRIAVPFALAAVFARVYGYIDSILLHQLAGEEAAGYYSIPYKITFAFQFIPLALIAALYPKMSEDAVGDRARLSDALLNGLRYLCLISFPIGIGIAVLARPIILMLYGPAYLPSVLPLQILVVSLIFSFASFPIGALLNATGKQATQTTIVGCVMVINIIANVLLIPRYSVVGAASAALLGNIVLTVCGYWFAARVSGLSSQKLSRHVGKIVISACAMAVAAVLLSKAVPVVMAILGAAVVYGVVIFFTRAVTHEDIGMVRAVLKKG